MLERFVSLVRTDPNAVAATDGASGLSATRLELLTRGRGIADELSTRGVLAGDALAVRLPNSIDFLATVVAALHLDLVLVPVDRDATEEELMAVLAQFEVRALAYTNDRRSIAFSTREAAGRLELPAGSRLVKLTSGSTGRPKGIVTTEANLVADATNICTSMDIRPGDVSLGAIPLSHSYGFSNLVTPLLLQGTALVISNDYLPQSLLDLANAHRCTVVPLIPMVFEHLATAAHGSFLTARTFLSAGAPLPPAVSRRFRERFGHDIHSFYGCSECGGITYDRPGAAVERGTVGGALDGVTLETDGERLAVSGPAVAAGYLLDAATFVPFADRRFVTDDLVEVRDGEIALAGRAGDVINIAGKKVNPREIEAVIRQIDGVRDVRVYGEAAGARGAVVAAAVVGAPDLTREQIRSHCRAKLSPHKVPRIVKLIDSLPLDERGKVKRAALSAM